MMNNILIIIVIIITAIIVKNLTDRLNGQTLNASVGIKLEKWKLKPEVAKSRTCFSLT